ncbi:MAG: ECF RNA polymerase sigma factor SigK [Candidatus Nanopelagicales bacterium]|jgi:RNA polymerase sigma-70 factor (ECF subfamily)|nr:ECF RNA polymerase sigma factor SigK [Candidatus Nanopelagicales bacterium]MCU0297057.1 ECF RNA polymerase sigma factor SigK [Candidatus Nanopelagicales bacterium]
MQPAPEVGKGAAPGPSDAELLAAVARGDEAAYELLFDRHASAAYGLAVRVVRDPDMARDVCQEALLQLWSHASRYDEKQGTVRSWLFTLVHRRAVDRIRSEQSSSDREKRVGTAAFDRPHDQVSAAVERSFEIRRVRGALSDLTPLQREAIELAYYRGYTHTQVAEALGIPLGTAKTRLRDGLIRLRDALGVEV